MKNLLNILYLCNEPRNILAIENFLKNKYNNNYDLSKMIFDVTTVEKLPWETNCFILIIDMVQSNILLPVFWKLKRFAHEHDGNIWINTDSKEFPTFITKCKTDIDFKSFDLNKISNINIFHGKTIKGNITITESITEEISNLEEILIKIAKIFSLEHNSCESSSGTQLMTWTYKGESVETLLKSLKTRTEFISTFIYIPSNNELLLKNSKETLLDLNKGDLFVNVGCFNYQKYSKHLKTKFMGKEVIHFKTITSTIAFYEKIGFIDEDLYNHFKSIVVVASSQTEGRGRFSNKWISNNGCMMFTHLFKLPKSIVGHKITFIQHLMALSFVMGIKTTKEFETLPIGIKWPNDIYYKKEVKIGGVLVKCLSMGGDTFLILSMGVNISNEKPTLCLNQIIEKEGIKREGLSIEEALAKTLSYLEINLFKYYEDENGPEELINLYLKYWIHDNEKVELITQDAGHLALPTKGLIIGIDIEGYLRVLTENGNILTAHPDGNSYNMMKNLIVPK